MLLALLSLSLQPPTIPACVAGEPRVCEVALPPARELRAMIGRRRQAWRVKGDVLTVVARRAQPAHLCCALQTGLRPAGGGLQAIALRVPDIDSAIIDIGIMAGDEWPDEPPVYRGRRAEAEPATLPIDDGRMSIHEIGSRHLGERRQVQVYLPPNMVKGVLLPAVYLGDGLTPQLIGVAEAMWQRGEAAPFMLVGISSSRKRGTVGCAPRCDGRSREYLIDIPDLPPEESRFDDHARFVTEEVLPLIEASFPASRSASQRIVGGWSSGGAWAVTMAARHPDVFGGTIAMSVGWLPAAQEAAKLKHGQIFVGGGRLEDRFYERSRLAADNAARAGANVRLLTPNAGHSMENWAILFADALRWHFPPAQR
jgi:enterochelin esterase-like enzyme